MRVPIRKPGKFTHSKLDSQITEDKFLSLKAELIKLVKQILPHATQEVKRLAEMGDFSENAAYQMAKGRLRHINQTISDLKTQLAGAEIIKPTNNQNIQIGHRVTITSKNNSKTYLILGSAETDPNKGVISYLSPIGSKLLGRKLGDNIVITTNKVEINYLISKIE